MPRVSEVGERCLIDVMMKHLTQMPGMTLPFWDDASAIRLGNGRSVVINTDMLVWESDVPEGMTAYQAARKAVVMNISDLGAKGVQPLAFMPSLGLPKNLEIKTVENFAQGFEAGAREYDTFVVGGDTNEACDVIISGLSLGVVETVKLMKREGSRHGEILATTGLFGETSIAFKILLEDFEAPKKLRERALSSLYLPKARVREGVALANSGVVTSCIDSSDGLAVSLHDLKRSSGNGFRLEMVPISPLAVDFAEIHGLDPFDLALYGGEEYEIVFTVAPNNLGKAKKALSEVGCKIIEIGVVSEDSEISYMKGNKKEPVLHKGWEHFIN